MTTSNTDQENKARAEAFNKYRAKTIYPESVNQLDFNAGYDSQEKKIQELKALLAQAKEIMVRTMPNWRDHREQWLQKYEEVIK